MNEFERKLKDIVGKSEYLAAFADPGREIELIDNYAYSIDHDNAALTITDAITREFNLVMDTDSDFVCTALAGYGRRSGEAFLTQNPAMVVQITDQSTGRTFFDAPAPMALVSGQGGFPYLLPSPKVIRARSTITVAVTAARSGATFTGFYFTFLGGRVFYAR